MQSDPTPTELALVITEQARHILALKREVRLLNRALGRKKRKINRLRESLQHEVKAANSLRATISRMMDGAELRQTITIEQAFAEHNALLEAGVQADPGIEVGGTTHGAGQ